MAEFKVILMVEFCVLNQVNAHLEDYEGKKGLNESNLKDLLNHDECVLMYEDKDGDSMLVGDVHGSKFI